MPAPRTNIDERNFSMLLKWIRCTVSDRPAFHEGQLEWARARDWPGFLGQCGGWDAPRDGGEFCQILGFWNEQDQYEGFMCGPLHSDIAAAQVRTMASIKTGMFSILGDRQRSFLTAKRSGVLNVLTFNVSENQLAETVNCYADAWSAEFDGSSSVLAGVCAVDESRKFVMASLWPSVEECRLGRDEFIFESIPGELRGPVFDRFSDDTFELEPQWSI
jgi:hypothetical protein